MATQACDTRNTIQNTTRDILENNNANTRAILDYLCQDKISTLQAENQSLKLAASQAARTPLLQQIRKRRLRNSFGVSTPCLCLPTRCPRLIPTVGPIMAAAVAANQ